MGNACPGFGGLLCVGKVLGDCALGGQGARAVDHGVGDDFREDDQEGEDGEGDLKTLGAAFAEGDIAATPVGRGAGAENADADEDGEVDQCAEGAKDEHGDADGVLVESGGRGVCSGGDGEGGEADGDADSADGEDGGAGALQDGEDEGSEG